MPGPQGQDPEKLQSAEGRRDEEAFYDTYEPDTIEVNRGREQGLGVGQKDIDYQRDPVGTVPAERYVNMEPLPRVRPPDPLPPELDPPPRTWPRKATMPHQNSQSEKATTQNAAPEPQAPRAPQGAPGPETGQSLRPEPQSYVAPDARDATLAPPASGEVGDYADEGDPIDERYDEVQMGGTRTNPVKTANAIAPQGPKTVQANKERLRSHDRRRRRP